MIISSNLHTHTICSQLGSDRNRWFDGSKNVSFISKWCSQNEIEDKEIIRQPKGFVKKSICTFHQMLIISTNFSHPVSSCMLIISNFHFDNINIFLWSWFIVHYKWLLPDFHNSKKYSDYDLLCEEEEWREGGGKWKVGEGGNR